MKIHQETLLLAARGLIDEAYHKALLERLQNPAVLVLDLNDQTAESIIATAKHQRESDLIVKLGEEYDGVPIAVWHLEGEVTVSLLPEENREISNLMSRWSAITPGNSFPVVVIGGDAIFLALMPVPR